MHSADIAILIVLAISTVFGVFRGFVREAFSLVGWFAAYVVARFYHAPLMAALADYVATPSVRLVLAWGGLFLATLVLALLLGYVIRGLMSAAGIGFVDRMLGAGFGFIRGLILVLAVLVMLAPFTSQDAWWKEAKWPQVFMRYELLGRELKTSIVNAAKSVSRPTSNAPEATPSHKQ
jgi:membrane protein required for colicin V production